MVRCVLQPALAWRGSFEKVHMLTFGMPITEVSRKCLGNVSEAPHVDLRDAYAGEGSDGSGKALARDASTRTVWLARPQRVDAQPAGRHRC